MIFGQGVISPGLVVYGVAAFAIADYFFYVWSVTQQITRVLDIPVFSVFKPPKIYN